jgi:hypothetical protein
MKKQKFIWFVGVSVLVLTVLITTVFAANSSLKKDGDGYILDTADMKFTEEYTYFDYYLDSISEDDRVATVNTEVSEAIKATRYDEKGNEIPYSSLTMEEKVLRVSEAKANLDQKYSNPSNEIDAELFPVDREIEELIIELVELEINLEYRISSKDDTDIEKMISEVYSELEALYTKEYEILEKYDLVEEEYEE